MPHSVHLSGSNRSFRVDSGESVLEAGLRQGLALPFGCKSGSCGSCRVRLLDGTVDPERVDTRCLSPAETRAGYVLMCRAYPRSDLKIALNQPEDFDAFRPRRLSVRVLRKRMLAADVVGLWLRVPHGKPFRFMPGQYVDFLLPDGGRRSFSIACGEATHRELEFHLRVAPGGRFAGFVRDQMPDRGILELEGPLGAFYLREEPTVRPALLVAGGTGFAPIKAMLERAFEERRRRTFHLMWGARQRADLYLGDIAERWAKTNPDFRYTPVLSEPDADWTGDTGLVHEAALHLFGRMTNAEVYIAGPPAMVHSAKLAFTTRGLDPGRLFYDSFDYAHDTWPGQA